MSNENPYTLCGGWQDNNGWCGPSNSLDNEGIKDEHWINVVGGDGMWAIPDPIDPNLIWADLQDGRVSIFNRKTQSSRFIAPYQTTSENTFDLGKAQYRFNRILRSRLLRGMGTPRGTAATLSSKRPITVSTGRRSVPI